MKKKILLVAAVVICFAVAASGTLAYFTAGDTAHNVITSGNIDIELLEWADEDREEEFPSDGIHGVVPGQEVTKIVEVENIGGNDAYVRIQVETGITKDGAPLRFDPEKIVLNFDEDNWTKDGDYYYYNEVLTPGETTEPLFTSVTFTGAVDNSYSGCEIQVTVKAHAVQADNNTDSALTAAGWPDLPNT